MRQGDKGSIGEGIPPIEGEDIPPSGGQVPFNDGTMATVFMPWAVVCGDHSSCRGNARMGEGSNTGERGGGMNDWGTIHWDWGWVVDENVSGSTLLPI